MPVIHLEDYKRVEPEEFLIKFQQLWAAQKEELKIIVGDPPDTRRVKSEHWKQWKKNQESALLLLMVGYSMALLNRQMEEIQDEVDDDEDIDFDDIDEEFVRETRTRARFASQRINNTTRSLLQDQVKEYSEEDGEFDLGLLFPDHRAEMIVRNEMTAARRIATQSIHTSLTDQGVKSYLIWTMNPCDHCQVCPLLDGTPEEFWSQFTDGPPLHPNCCCDLTIVFGRKSDLIRSGQMRRNPSVDRLEAAIEKYGF